MVSTGATVGETDVVATEVGLCDNIDDPDDWLFLLDPTEDDDNKTSTFSSLDRFSSNCMAVTSSVFG
jgi:hypothetical protein